LNTDQASGCGLCSNMTSWAALQDSLPVSLSQSDKDKRKELWQKMHVTHSPYLALFEIDAGIQKVLKCDELFDAKPVINRAYMYAREVNPKGPQDKLEYCEFRLLLVYLKGLFNVYQIFKDIDKSNDMVLSLEELERAGPHLAAAGVNMPNPAQLWHELRGTNEEVDVMEFTDWAVRQGMAGPELLEKSLAEDSEELSDKIKCTLKGWSMCDHGLVAVENMRLLLKKLDTGWSEWDLETLLKLGTSEGKINVDTFVDVVMSRPQ